MRSVLRPAAKPLPLELSRLFAGTFAAAAVLGAAPAAALQFDLPVLFGILTCESMEQALDRAGGKHGNKGSECAEAALHMVGLLKNLPTA